MAAGDETSGWHEAPAGATWTCPECWRAAPIAEWAEVEVGCEDCGSHEGRRCPHCGEDFEHVWGAVRMAEATARAVGI